DPTIAHYVGLPAAATCSAIIPGALPSFPTQRSSARDAAKQLLEQNTVNIATAEAIAKACVDEATKEGVKVSIAIYDQFGEPVYMYRMDGQARIDIETGTKEATTELHTRQYSKARMHAEAKSGTEARQLQFGSFANS